MYECMNEWMNGWGDLGCGGDKEEHSREGMAHQPQQFS